MSRETDDLRRFNRAQLDAMHDEVQSFPWDQYERPKTRGDCLPGGCNEARPCPWVSCKHHLYLDVNFTGNVQINFPDADPSELKESCSLDVADRLTTDARSRREDERETTLMDVGAAMNITRERVRQLEARALNRLRVLGADLKTNFLDDGDAPMTEPNDDTSAPIREAREDIAAVSVPPPLHERDAPTTPQGHDPNAKCERCPKPVGSPARSLPDPRLAKFCGPCRMRIRSTRGVAVENGFDWNAIAFPAHLSKAEPKTPPPVASPKPLAVDIGNGRTLWKGQHVVVTDPPKPSPAPTTTTVFFHGTWTEDRTAWECKCTGFKHSVEREQCARCKWRRPVEPLRAEKVNIVVREAETRHEHTFGADGVCTGCHVHDFDEVTRRCKVAGCDHCLPLRMPPPAAKSAEAWVSFRTTPWVVAQLEKLAETGRYGEGLNGVAEELLRAKLREIEGTK